jgi:hypothetical protein
MDRDTGEAIVRGRIHVGKMEAPFRAKAKAHVSLWIQIPARIEKKQGSA